MDRNTGRSSWVGDGFPYTMFSFMAGMAFHGLCFTYFLVESGSGESH